MVERMMIDARLERLAAEQAAEREAAWQRGRQASIDAIGLVAWEAWASQPVGAY
jgi:hypothetical protein